MTRATDLGPCSVAFVLSAGMLSYEILLTRVASVLLTSDHLFLVVSLALLGLAVGAMADHHAASRSRRHAEEAPGPWLSWNASALIVAVLALVTLGPTGGVVVLALSAGLPLAVTGLVLSRLFRLHPAITGSLYAADLLGAAAGALLVPASLTALGPIQAIVLHAVVQAALGAFLILRHEARSGGLAATAVALFATGLFASNWHDRVLGPIPVGRSIDKDLFRIASSAAGGFEIVESRWSTFGRTDLVRFADEPDFMSLFIDGAAGTPMFRFDGDVRSGSEPLRDVNRDFGAALPLGLLQDHQKDDALVIGPGGGRDVLLALQAGFRHVTAVDVNPQVIDIVKANGDYNGGLYTSLPNVEVVTDEGRRHLRASRRRFDLITLFMPITKSSRGLNAFALSEGYLFTEEAFRDYHEHLTDEGMLLVMAHGMVETVKLVTTSVEVLQADGMSVTQAMSHVFVLGSHSMPIFGLTRRPISAARADELHALAHGPLFDSRFSYVPGFEREWPMPPTSASGESDVSMMNPLLDTLAEGALPLHQVEHGLGLNLVPATDDRPFFFQFGLGPPGIVQAVLWLSLGTLLAVVIIPGRRLRPRAEHAGLADGPWLPLYFAGIGLAYVTVELVLFQKLAFHLGDPSRSLAVLLASLLAGSGTGSLLSTRLAERAALLAGIVSAALAVLVAILLPVLLTPLATTALPPRLAVAAPLLVAQGVPMGMLFPLGLRVAERVLGPVGLPWMWAINGAASVAGSALTILVAMAAGHGWSLALGVGCYLFAALAARRLARGASAALGRAPAGALESTPS